jgi:hypothetical protein
VKGKLLLLAVVLGILMSALPTQAILPGEVRPSASPEDG